MTEETQVESDSTQESQVGKVMIVHNDRDGILEIIETLKAVDIPESDILIAEHANEALQSIMNSRGRLNLLVLNTRIGGPALKDVIKHEALGKYIPYVVTDESIEIDPNGQRPEQMGKGGLLEHIKQVLKDVPYKISYGVPLGKILIVCPDKDKQEKIIASLREEGIDEGMVSIMNIDQALDAVLEECEREKQSQVTENREKIGLVILEDKEGAADLAEAIQKEIQIPPFVAIIKQGEVLSKSWEAVKFELPDLQHRLQQVEPENIEADMEDILKNAKANIYNKTIETAQSENKQKYEESAQAIQEKDEPVIESNEPIIKCWYEMLKEYPDLRRPNPKMTERLAGPTMKGRKVALFDVDGTLAEQFVMGRFVRFLAGNNNFDRLSDSIQGSNKKRNREGFNTLKRIVDILEKDKYKGSYTQLIADMNRAYAQMLAGIKVRETCTMGYHFSTEDFERYSFKHETYNYAKPVLELIKHLKVVPSLLTGMPAEAIEGYRQGLGIEERCHPLQLETRFIGGEMVYVENVLNSGGLSDAKENTASLIAANKNDILFHMGDQETDIPAMNVAMEKGKNQACGKGFFIMDPNSPEGQNHIADIKRGHIEFYRRGHLITLDKELDTFPLLLSLVHQLHSFIAIRDQMAKTPANAYDELRQLLNHLINNPLDLQQFYKDNYAEVGQEEMEIP